MFELVFLASITLARANGGNQRWELSANVSKQMHANVSKRKQIKANDGTCLHDVKARIAMAKQKMLQHIPSTYGRTGVSIQLKMYLFKCLNLSGP